MSRVRVIADHITNRVEAGKRSFVLSQAKRELEKFLEELGEEGLRWVIEKNKDLISFIPPEARKRAREEAKEYSWAIPYLTPKAIWGIVDPKWKKIILEYKGGREWAERQLSQLIALLK